MAPSTNTTQPSGKPNAGDLSRCTTNLRDSQGIVWTNCCVQNTTGATFSDEEIASSCPPVARWGSTCPPRFENCGNPNVHREMCMKESTQPHAYNDSFSLQEKCCPQDYSCGPTYDSRCTYMDPASAPQGFPPFPSGEVNVAVTNPQYLYVKGVFEGCDDSQDPLTPGVVGGLVACGIIGVALLCFFVLWIVRRRMYRDPRHQNQAGGQSHKPTKQQPGITVTKEIQIKHDSGIAYLGTRSSVGNSSNRSSAKPGTSSGPHSPAIPIFISPPSPAKNSSIVSTGGPTTDFEMAWLEKSGATTKAMEQQRF